MTVSIFIVLGITAIALILFMTHVVSVDVTAIIVMVALMVTGVLTPQEGLAGFSNSATVTILALLIISAALQNTGVVEALGNRVISISGRREWFTLMVVMIISAVTSAFVNTTAVVAVFIPVMFRISKALGIHVATLLIPLSFASMVGGTSTMIGTSTNLLINSLAVDFELDRFRIFQPVPMGLIFFAALVLFMLFIGRFMIPKRSKHVKMFDKDVVTKQYTTEVMVPEGSSMVGKQVSKDVLAGQTESTLLRIITKDQRVLRPRDYHIIESGDSLIIKADIPEIGKINLNPNFQIRTKQLERGEAEIDMQERELFEVLIPDNSSLLGQRIRDVDFFGFYDVVPLGVKKRWGADAMNLMNHKIQFGDILLLSGIPHEYEEQTLNIWIPIQRFSSEELQDRLPVKNRMWVSVFIVAAVVLLAVCQVLPISVTAWAGVAAMFLTGCITIDKAYYHVEWKIVFLLAGIIPLGTAITKTGADVLIADGIVQLADGSSLRFMVGLLFAITVLLTGIVSNQATAVLLVPIAFQLAGQMSLPPEPLLMTILFGASSSFLTPVGYQTNAMILGPGDYRFTDFLKVGGLLSLVFLILAVIFIPMLYG